MSRIHRVAVLLFSTALLPLQAQSTSPTVTISAASSANPAVYAAALTFTVAVVPPVAGSPAPTGVVSATLAGSNPLGSAILDATGHAVIAVPQMPGAGSNTLTFSYSGDARYAQAQSTFTQFLKKANTHTDAALNGNLHLSATVRIDEPSANAEPSASAGSAPSGTVQFFDGATLLGTATLSPSSLLTSVATLTASTAPSALTAVYSGDANFNVSRSVSAVQAGTGSVTLSVTSSANPSVFADPVTLQIAVAPAAASAPVPTGSVAASILGLFSLGSATLDSTGHGSLVVPLSSTGAIPWGFAAGSNAVTLTYSGDANYANAQTTFTQSVNKADTGATISVFDAGSLAPGGLAVHTTVFDNDPGTTPIGFALPGAGSGGNPGNANPTGSVQFLQGGAPIGTGTLSPTAHLESTANLLAEANIYYPVVATYFGDANYNASTVTSSNQSPPAPTVTVTSSANPTSFAQPVTFSVTVASAVAGGAIPTGTIVATVFGSETLGYATLDDYGHASFTVPQTLIASVCANCTATSWLLPWGLATGSNVITVTYSGDFSYAQTQTTFNEMVNKLDTLTNVGVTLAATSPKSFTIVATVGFHALQILTTPFAIPSTGSMSPSPTGNVAFFDGATLIGTVPLIQEMNFTSTATLTVSTLPASLSAVYYGDTNFNGSSSASTTLSGGLPVTMRVTAGGGSLVYGAAFPIVATLLSAPDAPVPTGTLTFFDGSQNSGWTATLDAAGTGTLLLPMPLGAPAGCAPACPAAAPVLVLSPGAHSITVTYSGDANYAAMTSSPLKLNIAQAPSITTVSGACTGLLPGQCVVAASVADAQPPAGGPVHFMTMGPSGLVDGAPSGTVQFFNGATSVGTASLTPSTTLGVTSTTSLSTTIGASSAVYSGDANFLGSTSSSTTPPPATKLATSVSLSSGPNPSTAGQSVTLTANVVPGPVLDPAIVAPTGTVSFLDGTAPLGQATLTAGMASFSTTFTTAGPHILSVSYSGDSNYLPSSSAGYGQTVNPQSGALGVLSLMPSTTISTSSFGQQLVFFVVTSGFATPGSQGFLLDGTTVIAGWEWDLNSSQVIVILPVGTHQLWAAWPGDSNLPPAVSPILTYVVTRAPTSTTLGSPSTNATSGQVVLVATVSPYPTGAGTPSGTVEFIDATTQAVLATSTLNAGSATATLPASDASVPVVAVYSGDANFAPNTTAPPTLAMVGTAANVVESVAAPDEIATLYGANLATSTASATPPLPTTLADASVTVTDIAGVSRLAPLYYASPGQINFVVPTGSASGPATLSVAGQSLSISVTPVSPSLFPVGQIVAVAPDGTQTVEGTDAPIVFGSESLYLVLYATGIRNRSSLADVTCTIGNNLNLPVTYAGAQSQFPGLDQVVVPLPASLQGVGTVRVVVTADGYGSNAVSLTFQ